MPKLVIELGLVWSIGRLGAIAREQGQVSEVSELHREALRLAQAAGDDHDAAVQLNDLCFLAWLSEDLDTAEVIGPDALCRMRELGDQAGDLGVDQLGYYGALSR